jgi:hypothetical protein
MRRCEGRSGATLREIEAILPGIEAILGGIGINGSPAIQTAAGTGATGAAT